MSRYPLPTSRSLADAFGACAFAEGKSTAAPECSAKVLLAPALERMRREAARGECDTGRYRMGYYVWGEGPPLVFVPGLTDDAQAFVLPMARLSRRFCCIVYDLPTGRGDGARLASITHAHLAQDLLALLDQLRLQQVHVQGYSFGSTIALRAMHDAPGRFARSMLVGAFAHRPLEWAEVMLASWARYWPWPIAKLPLRRLILRQNHGAEFAPREPGVWDFFLEHSGAIPMCAVAHRALLLHHTDLRPLLPQIHVPLLLICGDRDPLVGKECERQLLQGLPNAGRAEIEACGHLPQFTHPEVLAEIVEQYLLPERREGQEKR